MTSNEVLCYNKGCGKKFDPEHNNEDDCIHHPGVPVFHDALKGWTCCKRRTTDFSDFLNIPGCTNGPHSREKPAQPTTPQVSSSKSKDEASKAALLEKFMFADSTPQTRNPILSVPRPSVDEPMIPLPLKVTASLQKALQKLSIDTKDITKSANDGSQTWVCKHSSCNITYSEKLSDECVHHTGVPVFHEGMKYWSCCSRKTSDFTAFLAQQGCTMGTHEWKVKPKVASTPCRYDWHQTGSVVVISIFAKNTVADNSSVKVNQIRTDIELEFEGGDRNFNLELELDGAIDPSKCFVTLYGTKVEITLKKGDATHWKRLSVTKAVVEETVQQEQQPPAVDEKVNNGNEAVKEEQTRLDDDDDSDLSGIDDTEFD